MKNASRLRAVLVTALALVSTAALAQGSEPTLDVTRYAIEGDNPFDEARTADILASHLGAGRTLSQLEDASESLEKALRAAGYSFHRVVIPAQKPEGGVVRLQVLQFTLDKVVVSGNENFSEDNIRRSIPSLVEGKAPDVKAIGRDLTAANAHPAKNIQLTFREGQQPDTLDAGLKVRDVSPLAMFSSLNFHRRARDHDTNDSTYRFALGVQHSNLFDRDHVATLSYTTDLRPGRIGDTTLIGLFYQIPFHGTGRNVSAYYTYSDVSSGSVQQGASSLDIAGSGEFYGLRVTQALPRYDVLQHSLGAAIDFKAFDNKTTLSNLGVVQPLGMDTGSRPVSLRYVLRADVDEMSLGGSIEYAFNIGGGPGNNGTTHAAAGTEYHWDAWRLALDASRIVGSWTLSARLRAQWSGDALISGEQFGLGGTGSVRGFRDREASGERGHQVTLEAIGPGLTQFSIQPVFFVDFGQVYLRPRDNDPARVDLTAGMLSAGAGLRWNLQRQLDVALDIAHVLDGRPDMPNQLTSSTETGDTRLHLMLFYRF